MEIGDKVKWCVGNKQMQGLFMQIIDKNAEIICYQMGNIRCHLRVFVPIELISLDN